MTIANTTISPALSERCCLHLRFPSRKTPSSFHLLLFCSLSPSLLFFLPRKASFTTPVVTATLRIPSNPPKLSLLSLHQQHFASSQSADPFRTSHDYLIYDCIYGGAVVAGSYSHISVPHPTLATLATVYHGHQPQLIQKRLARTNLELFAREYGAQRN